MFRFVKRRLTFVLLTASFLAGVAFLCGGRGLLRPRSANVPMPAPQQSDESSVEVEPGQLVPADQPRIESDQGVRTGEAVLLPVPASSLAVSEPTEDLLLTGLSGLGKGRSALFTVWETGQTPSHFILHEGEQNEWLEVQSINLQDNTVKGRLKRPVVRMRTVGAEVVISFPPPPGKTE